MAVVLVVDDDASVRELLGDALRRAGHEPMLAATGADAIELAAARRPALALLDLKLEHENGLDVFRALRAQDARLPAVVVTGFASPANAFASGQAGLRAFVQKPIRPREIAQIVGDVLSNQSDERVTVDAPEEVAEEFAERFEGMVGSSPPMRNLFRAIVQAAALSAPVLITGETGTGKELVARAIHRRSARRAGPFVPVNCAAMPAQLFEAEFFGHERGVFTGADIARAGWFETASGGVLFLDEIGEIPLELQAKLLRTIDQRHVTRLGARTSRPTDVRIVAATNVDLERAVEARTFRADLFWRLNAIALCVPPVRERGDDIELLADHILRQLRVELDRPRAVLTPDLLSVLKRQRWPGNVREIEYRLRGAVMRSADDAVGRDALESQTSWERDEPTVAAINPTLGVTLKAAVADATRRVEDKMIAAAMDSCSGHLGRAAKALGIDERTLYTKLRRHRAWRGSW